MKRIVSLLLAGVLALSLAACGETPTPQSSENELPSSSQEPTNPTNELSKIGNTTTSEDANFEMTLLSVEFADQIYFNKTSEDFCTPMSDEEREANPEYALVPPEGDVFLCFALEYKFTGKEEIKDNFNDFGALCVTYNTDYIFDEGYLSFRKPSSDDEWYLFSHGYDSSEWELIKSNLGLGYPMGYWDSTYRVLEDTIYIARGYIELPEQVRDDTSAPVEVCFPGLGGNYSIR